MYAFSWPQVWILLAVVISVPTSALAQYDLSTVMVSSIIAWNGLSAQERPPRNVQAPTLVRAVLRKYTSDVPAGLQNL